MELLKTRLFPSPPPSPIVSTPLSILDATVSRFSPTGAIWLFDKPGIPIDEEQFLNNLQSSFITTLNDFPQWAGQLQWALVRQGGPHTHRFNRPMIVHGSNQDPGVEWRVVRHQEISVQSLAPTAAERALGSGIWAGDGFNQGILLSDTLLPLHNLRDFEGLPAMQVQVNLFNDGGYGVSIRMAHPLADAQSLMTFVHRWAGLSRKMFKLDNRDTLLHLPDPPIFDPARLDSCAAGNIDDPSPDPSLLSQARKLPLHRYDWWKTDDLGYPEFLIPTTENSKPPPSQLANVELTPSASAPWTTWDLARPVRYTRLHFTGAQITSIKELALRDSSRPDISRLDALLAHIWILINRARGHASSTEDVYLNITLGARPRVSPALPDSFIGSPLFMTHIRQPGAALCIASIGKIATQVRETMTLFTPETIGAMLHDAAYEVSPQRLWQAFLGRRHTLTTSWLRLGTEKVDFVGEGRRPRYVHAVMPKMDGVMQVMDPGVDGDEGGVEVAVYLEEEVMGRFVDDWVVL
ncbi:hypothetical protein FQN55_003758 [Onygenales sp. PD_40]|nr:hypothetical protein FQN55_003758 [Onygenales sp. PD_40]